MHLHEQTRFRSGFFPLRDMQVHLVTVKVRIVRWAYGRVEPEGFVRKNPYSVSHYRHSVKAGLPVEEHNVAVSEMSLHDEPWLQGFCHNFPVRDELESDSSSIGTNDVE